MNKEVYKEEFLAARCLLRCDGLLTGVRKIPARSTTDDVSQESQGLCHRVYRLPRLTSRAPLRPQKRDGSFVLFRSDI